MLKKNSSQIKKSINSFFSKNRYELVLFLFSFLVFASSLANKYSLDDELVTERNTDVAQGIRGFKKIFTSFYTDGSEAKYNFEYRPVVKATFALEYSVFGFNPTVSHFINVLLYSLLILILFRFLVFLFHTTKPFFAFLVCLLFAVHPLHTEVVASLKNRDEILSFMFSILMARTVFRVLLEKKFIYLFLAILYFALAALSKKDALVFLALIPLMGFYFYREEIKWIFIFPSLFLPWAGQHLVRKFLLKKEHYDRIFNLQENPLYGDKSFLPKIALGAKSFGFYLKMFFIPFPLCYYYGYNQVQIPDFFSVGFILPFLAGIFLLIVVFKYFKSNPLLSFGISFFILGISIVLNVLTPAVGIVAERFEFGPMLGLCIAFVSAFGMFLKIDFKKDSKRNFSSALSRLTYSFVFICFIFGVYSSLRSMNWKNRISLFSHDIVHLKESAKANELLASQYSSEASQTKDQFKRTEFAQLAIKHYKEALRIYPDYVSVYNNLASIYYNLLGDATTPIEYFKTAIKLDTGYAAAYQNLGMCYYTCGDTVLALKMLFEASKRDKGKSPAIYLTIAQVYFGKKDSFMWNENISLAKKKFPLSDLPHLQHANFFIAMKDTANWIQQLQYAVDKKTQNFQVYQCLINFYYKKGDTQKAQECENQFQVLQRNRKTQ